MIEWEIALQRVFKEALVFDVDIHEQRPVQGT